MEITTRVSSFISCLAHLKKLGTRYIPRTNHKTRKKIKRPMLSSSSVVETLALATAMVASSTIITIPAISSIISTPKTISVKRCALSFKSSKALMIIVVEDIESMPPRKRLSIWFQPSSIPAK